MKACFVKRHRRCNDRLFHSYRVTHKTFDQNSLIKMKRRKVRIYTKNLNHTTTPASIVSISFWTKPKCVACDINKIIKSLRQQRSFIGAFMTTFKPFRTSKLTTEVKNYILTRLKSPLSLSNYSEWKKISNYNLFPIKLDQVLFSYMS